MVEMWLMAWVIFTILVVAAIIVYIAKELVFWEPDYMYYTSDPGDDVKSNWKFDQFYEQETVYDETDDMIYSLYDEGEQ